jgi:hypothetical protein
MSPADARNKALREMGTIELRKQECRNTRGLALVDTLRQDVTYALRALRKSPGFSTVAILSLAIGIGANTMTFTFVNAVLLRPLPYPGSDRLVILHEHQLNCTETLNVHPVNFVEWRARARSFEALALMQGPPMNVMGSNGAEQIARVLTTSELFHVFGVAPGLGRGFTEEDTRPGSQNVVILGHGFWRRWFGGDPGVLGQQLAVQDGSLTIIGVGPPGFRIESTEPDAYMPLKYEGNGVLVSGLHEYLGPRGASWIATADGGCGGCARNRVRESCRALQLHLRPSQFPHAAHRAWKRSRRCVTMKRDHGATYSYAWRSTHHGRCR